MILVRENIDAIVNSCFSPEDVEILEFTQNGTKVTIKDQFLYHYETACYTGTLEALQKAIMYKIFQHQDLLLKIKDYRENIRKILDLGEYSKVSLGYKDQLGSETSIGMSGNKGETDNHHADKFSGVDQSENLSINDERTGTSQTNVTNKLEMVIPQPSITVGEDKKIDTYELGEHFIFKRDDDGQIKYSKSVLNNPQVEEGTQRIGYQNLTKDVTTIQSITTNTAASSRGSAGKSSHTSRSANANTKGSKLDEITKNVEFITNDARLRVWKTELPKLQLKFWNSFYNLFIYEQY